MRVLGIVYEHDATVCLMEDGKIVISNQQAESLLGLSRQALLGESFYAFLEGGELLRESISTYLTIGSWEGMGTESFQRVNGVRGKVTDVVMSITASTSDQKPLFTAILRQVPPQEHAED